jgi:hypothetical protein
MVARAKKDKATALRLAALARERTPAAVQAELEKIEAGYAEDAAIRKQQAEANVPRWNAIRKARGAAK